MAVLTTLLAFSLAKKVAVLTVAYAYGLPRVYRVVLRTARVHVAQPGARAVIARSTSRTLRTLRLPAKAVAALRGRLRGEVPPGEGITAASAAATAASAASAASAAASAAASRLAAAAARRAAERAVGGAAEGAAGRATGNKASALVGCGAVSGVGGVGDA